MSEVLRNPELILQARQIDRKSGEFSKYQIPVQKAVESLILDTNLSSSNKELVEFIEEYVRKQRENKIKANK